MKYSGALLLCLLPLSTLASDLWGGSIGVTNDYLVRGISRSNHDAALQGDAHVASRAGVIAGLFVSAGISSAQRSSELSPYVGFAWAPNDAWRTRLIAAHYSYSSNGTAPHYNYDEFSADATYQEWLNLNLAYSPNIVRYILYQGPVTVATKSVEANLQADLHHALTGAAGLGVEQVSGPDSNSFLYWSVGIHYDLKPVTLSLAYVNTSAKATDFFYGAAARNRWSTTIIWHF